MRVACILFTSVSNKPIEIEKIAEACLRFSPQIALRTVAEPAIFIEISKCKTLYTEKGLALRIQSLLSRFGVQGRIAIANDLSTALALAKYRKNFREDLPIEALELYSNPFQENAMKTNAPLKLTTLILKRLGIINFKKLCALPRSSLPSRFGKETLFALHCIESNHTLHWPEWTPPEKMLEGQDLDESYTLDTLEPILFLLKRLIDKSILRLKGRSQLVTDLSVRIYQEKYSYVKEPVRTYSLSLAFPQGSTLHLLSIINERLNSALQKEHLEAPVHRIEIEILKTVRGNAKQLHFFSKREEDQENLQSTLSRLANKLGFERVFFATPLENYLPEKSWKKTMIAAEAKEIEQSLPERPLRILKTPIQVRKFDQYFILQHKRWKVSEIKGPERLTGEWWLDDPERDYFRVKMESGEDFWIYQSARAATGTDGAAGTPEYYLHGMFD